MGEYAPDALKWLYSEVRARISSAELAGIIGDSQHVYGYHRSRNVLRSRGMTGDYSIQLPADRAGDGDAASALDIKFSASDMRVVTGRLLASARDRNDPRLDCLREFFGTVDNKNVTGWDCVEYHPSTSDDSHLWHVHLSVLRQYATDRTALAGVLSVITGDNEGNDVNLSDSLTISPDWVKTYASDAGIADGEISVATALAGGYLHSRQGNERLAAVAAEQAAARKREEALAAQVQALTTRVDAATQQLGNILAAVTALASAPDAMVRAATGQALKDAGQALIPPSA